MSGGSKKQTVGYRYYLGLHMGVCQGPVDALLAILAGDRVAWSGSQTASGPISIDAPELFGGEEKEGGIQGTADVMMGEPTQTANDYLTSVQGSQQPAYRGLLSVVYRKGLIAANNPYIKPWAFKVRRILQGWHGGSAWYPEKAAISFSGSQTAQLVVQDTKISAPRASTTVGAGLIINAQPTDVVRLTRPASPAYKAWRPLQSGAKWRVEFRVRTTAGTTTYLAGLYDTEDEAAAAAADFSVDLTGFSSYEVWFQHADSTNRYSAGFFSLPAYPGGTSFTGTITGDTQAETLGMVLDAHNASGRTTRNAILTGNSYYFEHLVLPENVYIAVGATLSESTTTSDPGSTEGGLSLAVSRTTGVSAMNPAHIVYQCLTDPEWGMGYPTGSIDDANFRAAADVFHAEGMGLCLHWTQQQPIEDFIQVVMDHAGCVFRQNPTTGLFVLKPIRDDYTVEALPVFDETNVAAVDSYQRAGFAEAINEITVRYDDAVTSKAGSVTLQNLAAVTAQGGIVAQSVSYPGLPTAALAQRVAMRDLRAGSSGLARVRMRVNRSAYAVLPGDVIRLNWPKLGITGLVLRVVKVNTGNITGGQVEIDAAEDVFGLGASTYVAQQPGGWAEPSQAPTVNSVRYVAEAPYYELQRSLSSVELSALSGDEGYLFAAAARPNGAAQNFAVATRPGGSSDDFETGAQGDYCPAGKLSAALDPGATAATLIDGSDLDLVRVGSYALIDQEIVRIDALDTGTGAVTLGRGVMDTVAAEHPTGAWVLFVDDFNASDNIERVGGEALDVRMLTRAGAGVLDVSLAPNDTLTFDQRAHRPYPPGQLRIAGLAYPESLTETAPVVSWAHRNRLQQNLEGDESGNIGPEPGTTYTVEMRRGDTGAQLALQAGISGTSYTPPAIRGIFPLRVLVWSVRAGLDSLHRHDYTLDYIWGLDATAAAVTVTAAGSRVMPAAALVLTPTIDRAAGDLSKIVGVLITGTPGPGEVAAITLNGTEFRYVARSSDTLATIAAGLAAAIDAHPDFAATCHGPRVVIDGLAVANDFTFSTAAYGALAYGNEPPAGFAPGALAATVSSMLAGSAVASDPFGANVALLLHMSGANGSTSFPDSSLTPKTVTAVGNAQVSTAQSPFAGGTSAAFDGAGDALSVASSSEFDFAAGDFTIEGFVRFNIAPSLDRYDALISKRQFDASVPRWVQIYRDGASGNVGKLRFQADADAAAPWDVSLSSTTSLNADTWYFFAITRAGNTFRLFINGALEASTTSSITLSFDTQPITIGGAGTDLGAPLSGNIHELRITPGVARYTASFTAPTQPFNNPL